MKWKLNSIEDLLLTVAYEDLVGFLGIGEFKTLYRFARNVKGDGCIVEIGSWKGKSTVALTLGSLSNSNVAIFAIDPFLGETVFPLKPPVPTYEIFKEQLKRWHVLKYVHAIKDRSENVAEHFDKPIEFLFVDGDHLYSGIKRDFDLWSPKIIKGGMIAFHDYGHKEWTDVKKFVDEVVCKDNRFVFNGQTASLIIFKKVG